jgi:hypothetical protein
MARSAGPAMSRWDGCHGDLGQSAGGGSSAIRCTRCGTRSGHHHEALSFTPSRARPVFTIPTSRLGERCYIAGRRV